MGIEVRAGLIRFFNKFFLIIYFYFMCVDVLPMCISYENARFLKL